MRQLLKYLKKIRRLFIFDKSIKTSLINQFRKNFLSKSLSFLIYEKEIIVISTFLFISSSYLYKNKKEKNLHFDWKSYLKIFSQHQLNDFIFCAIKYLLETNKIIKNKAIIEEYVFECNNQSFKDYYYFALVKKNAGYYQVDEKSLDFEKYIKLIEQCLLISNIIDVLKNNPQCVVDLISTTTKWKETIFSIFGNKSEYIAYSFFYNLNLKS